MFSTLRQGSLLYVIDKNGDMRFSIVRNPKVSAPYPEYKTAIPMPNTPMFVDIDGEDGNSTVKYTKMPATLSSHEHGGIFITENREAAQAELEAMTTKSKAVLDSIPYHKSVIAFCDKTLPVVNPSIAQDKERENKLNLLETRMAGIENSLSELNNTLKNLKTAQS